MVYKRSVPWNSEGLHRLMYAFIYRLYEPGHFADSPQPEREPRHVPTVRISGTNDVTADGNLITNLITEVLNGLLAYIFTLAAHLGPGLTQILLNADSGLEVRHS
jgi:hypothetical protein